jgi:hypothetical protein
LWYFSSYSGVALYLAFSYSDKVFQTSAFYFAFEATSEDPFEFYMLNLMKLLAGRVGFDGIRYLPLLMINFENLNKLKRFSIILEISNYYQIQFNNKI